MEFEYPILDTPASSSSQDAHYQTLFGWESTLPSGSGLLPLMARGSWNLIEVLTGMDPRIIGVGF
jgi:hypothetical protein